MYPPEGKAQQTSDSATPTRETHISLAVTNLDHNLKDLICAVDILEHRLCLILTAAKPLVEVDKKKPDNMVPLAQNLDDMAMFLRGQRIRIEEIVRRIEL